MNMNRQTEAHIQTLADLLHAKRSHDAAGDAVIQGKRGNIHKDGGGYSVAVMLTTGIAYGMAKQRLLAFCELRQDGDSEGVFHIPRLPTPAQCALLRRMLKIKKRKEYSLETLQEMRERARLLTPKVGKTCPVAA